MPGVVIGRPILYTERTMSEIQESTQGIWNVYTIEEREDNGPHIAPDRSVTVYCEDGALLITDGVGDMAYVPLSTAVDALRRAGYVVYKAPPAYVPASTPAPMCAPGKCDAGRGEPPEACSRYPACGCPGLL